MSDQDTTQSEPSEQENLYAIVSHIRPLTMDQYQDRVTEAIEGVYRVIGARPTREAFERERKRLFGGVEYLMLALLVILFIFSILHVFYWTRQQAINSYQTLLGESDGAGIVASESLYVILHQISVLGVTELGMIALSIYHIYRTQFYMSEEDRVIKRDRLLPLRFVQRYFFLILAALCGVVILGANLSSGFDSLVSFLVPILTISLSEVFARLFAQRYTETREIDQQYMDALNIYQTYSNEPTKHPSYSQMLSKYIQDWYRKNRAYSNVPWNPKVLNYVSARERFYHSQAMNDDAIYQQFMREAETTALPFLAPANPSSLSSGNEQPGL
jgi:hypothetical protein